MWKDPADPISVVSRWKAAVVGDGKLPTTKSVVHDPESVNAPEEVQPAGGPPGNASTIVIVTSMDPLAWAGPPTPVSPSRVIPAMVTIAVNRLTATTTLRGRRTSMDYLSYSWVRRSRHHRRAQTGAGQRPGPRPSTCEFADMSSGSSNRYLSSQVIPYLSPGSRPTRERWSTTLGSRQRSSRASGGSLLDRAGLVVARRGGVDTEPRRGVTSALPAGCRDDPGVIGSPL